MCVMLSLYTLSRQTDTAVTVCTREAGLRVCFYLVLPGFRAAVDAAFIPTFCVRFFFAVLFAVVGGASLLSVAHRAVCAHQLLN